MFYVFLLLAVIFLAFSNGGNDNIKGVSTLIGSNTLTYKQALLVSSIATVLGGVVAIYFASSLVKSFSGRGLLNEEAIQSAEFIMAVAVGAAITVFSASKIGMPISTTHALLGGLVGAGVASPDTLNFSFLWFVFVIPLILSPVAALVFSYMGYKSLNFLRKKLRIERDTCVCVGNEFIPVKTNCSNDSLCYVDSATQLTVSIDNNSSCTDLYSGRLIGMDAQSMVTIGHILSGAWVCFSRALNDVPKIAGLLLMVNFLSPSWGLIAITVFMLIGGLISSRKVARTMAINITPMNQGQGFTANGVTSIIVSMASIFGLPVSTTHVSVGALFGIGVATKQANKRTLRKIIYSWLLTVPIAAAISGLVYVVVS